MVEDDAKPDVLDGNAERPDAEERSDLFYHGIIRRLSPRKGTGVVRTASGRDVRFSYQMVQVSGALRSPKGLREGMVVGYDLGWGGHGLRVTKIKTYPRKDRRDGEDASRSHGQQRQGEDLAGQQRSHEDAEQGDVE